MVRTPEQIEELKRRVAGVGSWYHAIDLGDGVVTPGAFAMAEYLPHYRLPERMDGLRVLDVGASTGFFSFEFERRGAAEVVAVDLPSWEAHDWTPRYRHDYRAKDRAERDGIDRQVMRDGFALVAEAFHSTKVKKVEMAIYDLDPGELGTFDLVFSGSMLMHVRDPVLGIQRMRSVCKDDGRLIVSISTYEGETDEPVARFAGEWDQCNWWQMNAPCLRRVLETCDFPTVENEDTFVLTDTSSRFRDPTYVCHALPRRPDTD